MVTETVIWQLAVPTGFAPCASVQALKPSELAGLLVSVKEIVPAGVEAFPPAASVTVTVNTAVPPTFVDAAALIVVVVERPETAIAELIADVRLGLLAVSA